MKTNGCHNRPPLVETRCVQDGWRIDGTRHRVLIPTKLQDGCQYTLSALGQSDKGCVGCRHKSITTQKVS
jgi:hypothetical protein